MSNKKKRLRDARVRVRGVLRDTPDVDKAAQALILYLQAQAEADAQAHHNKQATSDRPDPGSAP